MRYFRWLLLLQLLVSLPLMAQSASVLFNTELMAEPYSDASMIASLTAKQKVDVGERQGGWYKATSSDGKSGWLRLTAVLLDSTEGRGESGLAAAQQFLQSGRSESSGVTAATGIRGLDSADVVNAKPDPDAVKKLDTLAVSQDESRSFAAAEKLTAHHIDYLPEGKK